MLEVLKSLLFGDTDPGAAAMADDAQLGAAALLVEAAMADGSMAQTELDRILSLLRERFDLTAEAASRLLDRAAALQAKTSQLFPMAKVVVDHYGPAERIALIEMLWEVVLADGHLHDYEASLVRRLAGLLFVPDQDSGAARLRALARLGLPDPTV